MPDVNILLFTCPRTNSVHISEYVTVNCSLSVQSGVGVNSRLHCVESSVLMRWWWGIVVLLTSSTQYRSGWILQVRCVFFSGVVVDHLVWKKGTSSLF
jgi:hypothetical protein